MLNMIISSCIHFPANNLTSFFFHDCRRNYYTHDIFSIFSPAVMDSAVIALSCHSSAVCWHRACRSVPGVVAQVHRIPPRREGLFCVVLISCHRGCGRWVRKTMPKPFNWSSGSASGVLGTMLVSLRCWRLNLGLEHFDKYSTGWATQPVSC